MATTAEIRQWLIDHGEQPNTKGALPARLVAKYNDAHGLSGRRLEPLPGPGDAFYDDIGELVPDEPAPPGAPGGTAEPADPSSPPEDAGPVTPDAPPAHARRDWGRQAREKPPRAKPPRLTKAVQDDINAKISLVLAIPGGVWEARDPICGGTFAAQRPELAAALTDIVCQSPDLVAWFTGQGGMFMLWLNVMAACWPVITVIMAHHVYHSIEAGEFEQPDQARYAA